MQNLIISSRVIQDWKNNCKRYNGEENNDLVKYLIKRAAKLGQVVYLYDDGSKVVRYHDIEIMISEKGCVLGMERKFDRENSVKISESVKNKYDEVYGRKAITQEVSKWKYMKQKDI